MEALSLWQLLESTKAAFSLLYQDVRTGPVSGSIIKKHSIYYWLKSNRPVHELKKYAGFLLDGGARLRHGSVLSVAFLSGPVSYQKTHIKPKKKN